MVRSPSTSVVDTQQKEPDRVCQGKVSTLGTVGKSETLKRDNNKKGDAGRESTRNQSRLYVRELLVAKTQ